MTNAESYLSTAVAALESGKLNDWETNFVSQFKNYNKKQLRDLSSAQFKKLRDIASKYE